ncbi:MAG: hypothetical protein ABIO70_35000 [Pseudomonadota bacterium]
MSRRLSLLAVLIGFFLAALPLSASAEEGVDSFPMNDVRATVHLPPKWVGIDGGWSDAEFAAKSKDGLLEFRLFFTPFQVTPSREAAEGWFEVHKKRLASAHAGDIKQERVEITQRKGRPVAEVDVSFRFEGDGPEGAYQTMVFPAYGKDIHLVMLSNVRNKPRGREAIEAFYDLLEVQKEAEDLTALQGKAVSPAAFESNLPDGWRVFAPSEIAQVTELAKKTRQGRYDKDACWAAVRPQGIGDPDFFLVCQGGLLLDFVDEYSWTGIEPQVREKLFGGSGIEVAAGEKVVVGDRLGFLFRLPARGDDVALLAVAPYDQGVVIASSLAQKKRAALVEEDFNSTLQSTRFTGEGGGKQPMGGPGGWFLYSIRYRPTNPLFLGPVVLFGAIFLGIIVLLARHKPKDIEDY